MAGTHADYPQRDAGTTGPLPVPEVPLSPALPDEDDRGTQRSGYISAAVTKRPQSTTKVPTLPGPLRTWGATKTSEERPRVRIRLPPAASQAQTRPDGFRPRAAFYARVGSPALAAGSLHYICMDWRHLDELLAAGGEAYGGLKNLCVWVKHNSGMGSLHRSQHELIFVFKQCAAAHRNNIQLGQFGRNRSNVWHYPGANSFGRCGEEGNPLTLHPTVKPVALVADAILDCTERGGIVLDTFLGSGTTLIAAERTGRRCCGMELDPGYVDTTIRRWQALTGGSARHAASGSSFDELAREAGAGNVA